MLRTTAETENCTSPLLTRGRLTETSDVANDASQKDVKSQEIRPDELADALRAIERDKRQVLTATLTIGDAVSVLDEEVSAEELWTMVQAQRLERSTRIVSSKIHPKKKRQGTVAAVGLVTIAFLALAFTMTRFGDPVREYASVSGDVRTGAGGPAMPLSHPLMSAGLEHDIILRSPTMRSLKEIRDGEMITAKVETMKRLVYVTTGDQTIKPLTAKEQEGLYFETNPPYNGFRFVRLNGKWYIRGWMVKKLEPAQIPSNGISQADRIGITLWSKPTPGHTIPAQIPVSEFHGILSEDGRFETALNRSEINDEMFASWTAPQSKGTLDSLN